MVCNCDAVKGGLCSAMNDAKYTSAFLTWSEMVGLKASRMKGVLADELLLDVCALDDRCLVRSLRPPLLMKIFVSRFAKRYPFCFWKCMQTQSSTCLETEMCVPLFGCWDKQTNLLDVLTWRTQFKFTYYFYCYNYWGFRTRQK
ncbi:hypothetical protein DPMN_117752 [Dreissena polymorpha]|uniref:Uncharacterized protein n=1 Tax=Dreissena polymorpha TaxID=45954 RepID=A0A9D4GIW3_DREPO|nr:hypothetical protein DPMN_117752 [Dreissena polymorpha]